MKRELVEIYSDATNAAVMRHPTRRYPGVLVQGDTLYSLCVAADELCARLREVLPISQCEQATELQRSLWSLLMHYKNVLADHDIPLPFSED